MPDKLFIVVSGLPASGKSTLAARLAEALELPLLDKDDILEALFSGAGDVDPAKRSQLSRMSDDVLAKIAAMSQGSVIVSHWRHEDVEGASGTPVAWLKALPGTLVEVYCACPPDIAERRFRLRQRHPAHHDGARAAGLGEQLRRLAERGPLLIGPTVTVRTDKPYDFEALLEQVRSRLAEV